MAVASVAKVLEILSKQLFKSVYSQEDVQSTSSIIELCRLTSSFLEEASIDKLFAGIMLYYVMARQDIWLSPWVADPASK